MSDHDRAPSKRRGRTRKLPATPIAGFPYRIEGRVGKGSMGVVFRAHEPDLDRPVAIKVLRPELPAGDDGAGDAGASGSTGDPGRRFLQEARSAAALNHPGAVTIHRVGRVNGLAYIAMEWLDGETLAARLARGGPLSVEDAVRTAAEALDALGAAHRAGIVHRDVKPGNLMLLRDGRVKVTDFGIARSLNTDLRLTRAGMVVGTPLYASPEQLWGEDVDARSDLFAVAVVLYEMLTGRLPFGNGPLSELMARLARGRPDPLRNGGEGGAAAAPVPGPLRQVVLRGLAADRALRFASAAEMAAALRAVAGGVEETGGTGSATAGVGEGVAIPADPGSDAPTRLLRSGSAAAYPSYAADGADLPTAVAQVVTAWSSRGLSEQRVDRLLARLLEPPLHAAAFAGAVVVGPRLLLLARGRLLAALDRRTGASGDAVVSALPERAAVTLHGVPEGLAPCTVELLAGLLAGLPGGVRRRQSGLSSSVLSLPAFARQLQDEGFTGLLHLRRGARNEEGRGYVLLAGGHTVLTLFLGDWSGLPVDTTWTAWAGTETLRIDVEEPLLQPLAATYRLRLAGTVLDVRWNEHGTGEQSSGFIARRLPRLAGRVEARRREVDFSLAPGADVPDDLLLADPVLRFLRWLCEESSGLFAEKELSARWKYLAEWLPMVRRAVFYGSLPGPEGGGARDTAEHFDAATYSGDERILHLVRRVPDLDRDRFDIVLDAFVAAKRARLDSGDIGAALLVAPFFSEPVVSRYLEAIERSATGLRRLQESFTGYAGFVRVGPTRGFHLLLVEEQDEGYEPMLL